MDISRDGKRALILFYIDAVELALDFSQPIPEVTQWRDGRDYQRISLMNLPQQEAIAYTSDGSAFFYDTEARGSSRAHLMQVKKRF
jgi:rare lipoprotein A (peptidoglycan hydrolase)